MSFGLGPVGWRKEEGRKGETSVDMDRLEC